MDTREHYQREVLKVLENHLPRKPDPDSEVFIIKDLEKGHFQLAISHWSGQRFRFNAAIHIQLRDGKVIVRLNKTEDMIGDSLHQAGVPRDDIILAYHSPAEQRAAGFGDETAA